MPNLKLPPDFLELPVERAARLAALGLLHNATAARERLIDPADADALHDFRVAIRRLRSWMRAFERPLDSSVGARTRRRLKAVARATGSARDLEVHLARLRTEEETLPAHQRGGVAHLRTRLEHEHEEAEGSLRSDVVRDYTSVADKLSETLVRYTVLARIDEPARACPTSVACAEAIRRAGQALRDRLGAVATAVDRPTGAHRVRIEAKRLRYLLDPIVPEAERAGAVVDRLVQLQDLIGQMHDDRVLLQEVLEESENAVLTSDDRTGLAALAATLRERESVAFTVLEREWLANGAQQELFEAVYAVAADLASRTPADEEIERKYLLRGTPPHAHRWPVQEIEQGYLPGDRLTERLRRVEADGTIRWYRTVKFGSGIVRTEIEEETTARVFETMWPLTEGRRVRKRRYTVPDGERAWEIDEFVGRDLVLAEVELPAPNVSVDPPAWLSPYVVREVTGEAEYTNRHLAA